MSSVRSVYSAPKFFVLVAVSLCVVPLQAQTKKSITPEMAFTYPPMQLTKELPNITGWENDKSFILAEKKQRGEQPQSMIMDAVTGKTLGEKKPEPAWNDIKDIIDTNFRYSVPVLSSQDHRRYIYAKDNDLFLLDVGNKTFKRLTNNPAEEKNPTLSPDGNMVAFTRDANLYAIDLKDGAETQLTNDGGEVVYNGWAAWVYYEEIFGRPTHYRAFWWSPDSKEIAFYRFDETNVPMFPIYNSRGQHGTLERTHYPEAGDPNPMVRLGIADVASRKIVWADFNEHDDQYFGTPYWTPDGDALWTQWMNRAQNDLKIYRIDPSNGMKKEIYDEQQASWVDWLDDISFLKQSGEFVLKTDRDGWMHLYLYGMDGRLKNRITEGEWQVSEVKYIDEGKRQIYFTARKEASTRTDFYRANLDGTGLRRLTFGAYTHSVNVSPEGSFFVTTYSSVSTPPKMALCNHNGEVIREIGDSWQKDLDEYDLAKTDLITIPTSDGYHLPALITLPPRMEQGKKYPVLISIYGGPNSGTVFDGWHFSMQGQGLAAEGLIQFSVDHRASGHFGKKGVALMYHHLGKWEMNDYIEAVKWLRTLPYVDAEKICITGGSYGGYVTCMALTYGAEYFQYGIANSSVTDWRLYDTHYTERYMGKPDDNPEGYAFGSVLTHVDNYKGLLRIVHGSTDDNVHYQNSLQLIDTLENLGKHFEFMTYPNERHGIGPPKSSHARMESLRFYYKYLLEKPFPAELFAKKGRSHP